MRKYRGRACGHDRKVISIYLLITWENFNFLTLLLVRLWITDFANIYCDTDKEKNPIQWAGLLCLSIIHKTGSWYNAIYQPVHWKYFHPGAVRSANMKVVIRGIRVTCKTKTIATQMSLNQASSFSVIVRSPKAQSLHYLPLRHISTKVYLTRS